MEQIPDPKLEKLNWAKKRVNELKGFYIHLAVYLVFNAIILLMHEINDTDKAAFGLVALGWGIGLVSHGLRTFRFNPFLSGDWEERKIREFMEEDKQNPSRWE